MLRISVAIQFKTKIPKLWAGAGQNLIMSVELKVLVVGPTKSGKTALSNFISDVIPNAENPTLAPCKPTVGCRILEFERQVKRGTGTANVGIELWDVSGDRKYEDVWPAVRHNAIGVIFVYDGDKSSEELENWYLFESGVLVRHLKYFLKIGTNGLQSP